MAHEYSNYAVSVGLRNVGSYQVSGHPWITGSLNMGDADTEHTVSFPYVTKNITVIASGTYGSTPGDGHSIKIHFNSNSDPGDVLDAAHFITLDSDEDSMTFDVKCKEIFLTNVTAGAQFQLFACLTNIPTDRMYTLTGSGLTDPSD